TFNVKLPNGRYKVNLIFSSWIASSKRVDIKINGVNLPKTDYIETDKSYYMSSYDLKSWTKPELLLNSNYDVNRPSKLIKINDGKYVVAVTSFNKKNANIELLFGK